MPVNEFKFQNCRILSDGTLFYKYDGLKDASFPWSKMKDSEAKTYFKDNSFNSEQEDKYYVYNRKTGTYIKHDEYEFHNVRLITDIFQISSPYYTTVGKIRNNPFKLDAKGYVIRKSRDDGYRFAGIKSGKKTFSKIEDNFCVFPRISIVRDYAKSFLFRTDILEIQIVNGIYKELRYVPNF